jgi:hypothetical protein
VAFKSIFKTKSFLPKITKVSSSIFGRRSTANPILTPSGTPVSQTLVETNNILQEIQKQLALDFAYRIAQEEDEIKNIRKTTSTMKGGKIGADGAKDTKLGGGIGKVFQTVTTPIKGVFSRILGFFGWLAAGFVVNKGLKWLSDNSGRVDKIVNIVSKHWKLIAGLVIGGIIFNTVSNLLGTVVMLRGAFNLLKKIGGLPFRGRSTGTTGGGTTGGGNLKKGLTNKQLSRLNASHARNIAGTANIGDKARLIRRGFTKVPVISSLLSKMKGTRPKMGGGGRVGPILMTIDGIFNYFDRINSGQSQQKAVSGTGARLLGTGLGWKGGAAIGTAIAPGIGTIIGGVLGSLGTSMLFENVMDKVSDNMALGDNQLSQVGVSDHEKLFHNRKRGGNVSVVDLGTTDDSGSSSFGPSGEAAMASTFSSQDLSNMSLAHAANGYGLFNRA